jgi:hypothetical protein
LRHRKAQWCVKNLIQQIHFDYWDIAKSFEWAQEFKAPMVVARGTFSTMKFSPTLIWSWHPKFLGFWDRLILLLATIVGTLKPCEFNCDIGKQDIVWDFCFCFFLELEWVISCRNLHQLNRKRHCHSTC